MVLDIGADNSHRSHLQAFEFVAQDRLLVADTHLPFPTFGYMAKRNGS